MEKFYSFVDLPTELIFHIVSDFEFDVRHVLKLRAINRAHHVAYDIENILQLYKRYPQQFIVSLAGTGGTTFYTPFHRGTNELLLEYAKQLAKTLTWPQIRDRVARFGTYTGVYSVKTVAMLRAIATKNKNFLSELLMDVQFESERKNYSMKSILKCAMEPNDEEYTKFILAHPILAKLQELCSSGTAIDSLIGDYFGAIGKQQIKPEIIAQIIALFKPAELAKHYHWIHRVMHEKFDMNIVNGVMAYLSPPIQIIYKAQIKNCSDCLYSALCSNSFASLLSFWEYGELPRSTAYYINAPISPNGLEWLLENIRMDQGIRRGLECITGDIETEKRILMQVLLKGIDRTFSLINREQLEVFKKLADVGLRLTFCSASWRKILFDSNLSTGDLYEIIDVVWEKFPAVIRQLLPKIYVWSMEKQRLVLVARYIISKSPRSLVNDLRGDNSGYTLLHGFASSLKHVEHTPLEVLKVIDEIIADGGLDINALDKEGRAFFDYFDKVWYYGVPLENIILLEGFLDRGLQFQSQAGSKVSPYWFNPTFQLDPSTRCISMSIKVRPQKYRCIKTLSYDFFEGEIVDLALEANVLWHNLRIREVEPRYVNIELVPGEYCFRWLINFTPFVNPNLPIVISKEGEQFNRLIVTESEDNMYVD